MLITILGWVGAIVILAGYGLFSLGRLPNGPVYQLTNLVGAILISVNVASHGAYPSAVVNGIWAIIAAVVLVRMARTRLRARRDDALDADPAAADESGRRIETAPAPETAPSAPLTESVPLITAALTVVALAAAQHDPQPHATEAPFAESGTAGR